MTQAWFSIGNRVIGDVRVDPLHVRAEGGPHFPALWLDLRITLKHTEYDEVDDHDVPHALMRLYTLIQLSGSLLFIAAADKQMCLAEFQSPPVIEPSRDLEIQSSLRIPLDPYKVHAIEEMRQIDIDLQLSLNLLIACHPVHSPRTQPREDKFAVLSLEKSHCDIVFRIPQSHWIDHVLPGLGYGIIKIIEVPTPEQIIPCNLSGAVEELQQAASYMTLADYDKAVGHCRSALEHIVGVVDVPADLKVSTYNAKIKIVLAHLEQELSESKAKHVGSMIASMWSLTSIPQHSHPRGYFSRSDADFIVLLATALLSYMGKLATRLDTTGAP